MQSTNPVFNLQVLPALVEVVVEASIIIFSGLIDVFPDGGNHLHTPLKRSYVSTGTLRTRRRRKFKVDLE